MADTYQGIHLVGELTSSNVDVVPLTPQAQARLEALRGDDARPQEVVVRISEGGSTKGWYYEGKVLERFHQAIQDRGMAGYKGHRKQADLDTVFPDPVTHWLGSKLVDEGGKRVLYARGLVDAAAGELKRWLKGGAVTQPSFYGNMRLQQGADGQVRVVDTTPMSIDWAPLGHAGMATSIVAMSGEMDAIGAPPEGGLPAAAPAATTPPGGQRMPTLRESCGNLRDLSASPAQVIREMGWRAEDVLPALVDVDRAHAVARAVPRDVLAEVPAGELAAAMPLTTLLPGYTGTRLEAIGPLVDQAGWDSYVSTSRTVGEMADLLGLAHDHRAPAEVYAALKGVVERDKARSVETFAGELDSVLADRTLAIPEAVRPAMRIMLQTRLQPGASKDEMVRVAGELKAGPEIKPLLTAHYGASRPAPTTASSPNGTTETSSDSQVPAGLVRERRRI